MGRGARLLKPLPLGDVIEKVKHLVGKDKIRVAYAHKKGKIFYDCNLRQI